MHAVVSPEAIIRAARSLSRIADVLSKPVTYQMLITPQARA